MLWLCIHLPQLPLEVFSRGATYPDSCVIVEGRAGQRIGLCNGPAIKRGIRAGMKLAAARALASDLRICTRDLVIETRALQGVAAWVSQFSSLVSLSPPQSVLLEVQGSLALFGSLKSLMRRVAQGIDALGYTATVAVAPTPMASLVLARVQVDSQVDIMAGVLITSPKNLLQALGDLSLKHFSFDRSVHQALVGMGVRTFADCLQLPRDGLARRFGPGLLDRIDQLTGKIPDPQVSYSAPARFHSCIALPSEVEEVEALLFVLHRLFLELSGFLQSQGAGIQRFDIHLKHRHSSTRLSLAQLSTGRNIEKMQMLARERLERLQLEAPIQEVTLRADTLYELAESNKDFFGYVEEASDSDLLELLERLSARLGKEAIHGVYQVAEHRPEQAWRYGEPGESSETYKRGARPVWLLSVPIRLQQRHGRPWLHGELHLHPERERIESGWWDGDDVQRDYFIAHDCHQSRYWIFRDLEDTDSSWYLHGIFE